MEPKDFCWGWQLPLESFSGRYLYVLHMQFDQLFKLTLIYPQEEEGIIII